MNATSDSSDSGESTEQELKTLEEETIIDHDNKTEA
jgi:hypothetical protein